MGCARDAAAGACFDLHDRTRAAAGIARHRQALRPGAGQSRGRPHAPSPRRPGAARRERRRQDHPDEHPLRHLRRRTPARSRSMGGRLTIRSSGRRARRRHRHGAPALSSGDRATACSRTCWSASRAADGRLTGPGRVARLAEIGRAISLGSIPTAWSATLASASSSGSRSPSRSYRGARILVLDEPTATLTPRETEGLFAALRAMAAEGHGRDLHQPQARRGARDHRPHHRHAPWRA